MTALLEYINLLLHFKPSFVSSNELYIQRLAIISTSAAD